MEHFESVCDHLKRFKPISPVLCHRPNAAVRAAQWFIEHFPGDVLYAVKANPSPLILDALYKSGIRHFDIASLAELDLVHHYSGARFYCMNVAKHPEHIQTMYFEYGVRDFSLDCMDELQKILLATNHASDLNLHIRISVKNSTSYLPLDKKFGANLQDAVQLLQSARAHASELGVTFHVGSQAMNPLSYARAISRANQLVKKTGIILDSLDVGGGFPAAYPGMISKPLDEYMQVIISAFQKSLTSNTCQLKCEPGRALVAEAASLLVNITLRKDNWLYLNDGAYGGLFDASHFDFPYPVRALRDGQLLNGNYDTEFYFYGPTCDSIDAITKPYLLPVSIQAGDYIEIGQLGAYSDAMRTNFNGFGARDEIILTDEPMLSLYTADVYKNSISTIPV